MYIRLDHLGHCEHIISIAPITTKSFWILDFGNFNLPFDLAQGGELVEQFRISCFGFRISTNKQPINCC